MSVKTALLSDQIPICRICLEDDANELIRPCLCRGTHKFVHKDCAKKWLKFSNKRGCDICGTQFMFETQKLRPMSAWNWPQPISEDVEDQLDFSCCVIWILFNSMILYSVCTQGLYELHLEIVHSFDSSKLALVWWFSLFFNMVYYSTRIVAIYDKWLNDNSDYEWIFVSSQQVTERETSKRRQD